MRISVIATTLLTTTGVACAASLTAAVIKSDIVDKTFQWDNHKDKGSVVYKSDGTSSMTIATHPGLTADSGKWALKGNQICVTWEIVAARCFTLEARGPGKYKTSTNVDWSAQ
jgi:hypothetical protein